MKLYHYSVEEFDKLKSLNLRRHEDKSEIHHSDHKKVYSYGNHISFLFEPIPNDIALVTHNEYSFWKSGKKLYEHVVDASSLPLDIPYYITETPEKIKLLYVEQDWSKVKGNPQLIDEFKRQIEEMEARLGYKGKGRAAFIKAAQGLSKDIKKYFQAAYKLALKHPSDDIFDKYAACVPHAMLYPALDPVKVKSVKLITLD